MPGRNIGTGAVRGMEYVQQRNDSLDAQAQEQAIRNAHLRLQQQEFEYTAQRDRQQDRNAADRQALLDKQKTYDDANEVLKLLYGAGVEGPEVSQHIGAFMRQRGVEPNPDYLESLVALPRNPMLVQKEKTAWEAIKSRLTIAEQKRMDMIAKSLYESGAASYNDANAYAFGVVKGEAVTQPSKTNQEVQNPSEQSTAPTVDMSPVQSNPFLQQILNTPAQGGTPVSPQISPQGGVGSLLSPKASSTNEYKKNIGEAAKINTKIRGGRLELDKAMNPLLIAEKKSRLAKLELEKAHEKEQIRRMQTLLPYEEMMKQEGITRIRQENEAQSLINKQKLSYATWLKERGYGSAEAYDAQRKANEALDELIKRRDSFRQEKAKLDDWIANYQTILKRPTPDPTDITGMDELQKAQQSVPGMIANRKRINDDMYLLNQWEERVKDFANYDVKKTDGKGKEIPEARKRFPKLTDEQRARMRAEQDRRLEQHRSRNKPPAVITPSKKGGEILPRITPPPGAKKVPQTRKTKSGTPYTVLD